MIIVSVCPRCGIIEKSDKMSCCGRGGSWFKNCGGAGNAKLQHTWYEGIQACKAQMQSKTAISQQNGGDSSHDADMTNSKAVAASSKMFAFTSVNTSTSKSVTPSIITSVYTLMVNTPTNVLMTSSTHTSDSTSIIAHGCESLLKISVHINLLFIIVFSVIYQG